MARIRFHPSGVEIRDVPEGTRIVDVCDENPEVAVPFDCRAANCATCRVEVLQGMDGLKPPADDEAELLRILGDEPRIRLACQLRVGDATAFVELRVAGESPPR